ncbi:MAG: CpsD/CapB family tyrosine-protein kinase [Nitrospiraceae bacterium]|nr:CpsD/CapB family tyrosine-protein kinase [Nitrospiraceae bacterium]
MSKIYEALKQASSPASTTPVSISPSYPDTEDAALEKAMLRLYQGIDSLLQDLPQKMVQFIGARRGEGASAIVRDFGLKAAMALGKPVLIFDADRANPAQHIIFGITPEYGWEDLLDDDRALSADAGKAIYQIRKSNLYVCPVSPKAASARHVFDPAKMMNILNKLKERYDFVIVDSPPAALSSDGIAICRNMDGVVLVLEAEATRWPVAINAKETIKKNGGRILGIAFNKHRYHIPDFIYRRL